MPEGMGRQFFVIGEQGSVAVDNIAGSVRQLDPKITWERRVYFFPFTLVSVEEGDGSSGVR